MTEPSPAGRRRYTVIGAGAVGLLYGTRLAVAGHAVGFLVRSSAAALGRDGIEVRDSATTWRIGAADVQAFDLGDPAGVAWAQQSDVVVVAVKATGNDEVLERLPDLVGADTTVALFQNGLGVEDRVLEVVPGVRAVVAGLCFVCANRTGIGRCHHVDYGAVTLASVGDDDTPAEEIAADLRAAGVEASVFADLTTARWRKLVWNIPFNGLCTVLDTRTDALLAEPATRALVADLMGEVIAGAQACGADLAPEFCDEMLAMTDAMHPYDPSMKLDRVAGRPLELDTIYAAPLAAAALADCPMPRVEMLYRLLVGVGVGVGAGGVG